MKVVGDFDAFLSPIYELAREQVHIRLAPCGLRQLNNVSRSLRVLRQKTYWMSNRFAPVIYVLDTAIFPVAVRWFSIDKLNHIICEIVNTLFLILDTFGILETVKMTFFLIFSTFRFVVCDEH